MNPFAVKMKSPGMARRGWTEMTYIDLSNRSRVLFRAGFWVAVGMAVFGMLGLLFSAPDLLLPFLLMVVPAVAGLGIWAWSPNRGVPLLPIFLAQQGLIYSLPLALRNPALSLSSFSTVMTSGVSVGLFLVFVVAGWFGGSALEAGKPSRWNIRLGSGVGRSLSLALSLLGATVVFELANRTGLLFKLLPAALEGAFPVIRTFSGMASMLGAMLGGLAVGGHPNHVRSWIFWTLLMGIGILVVADVLLSAASGLVLSAAVGLALGMKRVPWRFLLITFGIVGFLNKGKFVMRDRYWTLESNATSISLSELPAFYLEWAGESARLLFGGSKEADRSMAHEEEGEGQSILDRVNNLQNVTFVVEAMELRKIRALWGETYALIPPLLIPRIFWKDKPTAHEGQILLNLHFGRQATAEQAKKTFIAWGLLPEAIGNFGIWLGPVMMGSFYGFLMGWLERVSMRKRLLSVEGFVLSALMLLVAASYEMVASVFVTATFQALVAVIIGGLLLRKWFAGDTPAANRNRRRGNRLRRVHASGVGGRGGANE